MRVAGLDEQRNHENEVRAARSRGASLGLSAYHGMQNSFEALARFRLGKCAATHARTIECAARVDCVDTERGADRFDRPAAGTSELMGDRIGVDHLDSAFGKELCDARLAATDASG